MLKIENLTKVYSNKAETLKVLENCNYEFTATGLFFVVGKSGSGKSTLLNLLMGIDKPTSGSILYN